MSDNKNLAASFFPKGEEGTRLVLAGNPNVGKSVFFNHLTGVYVDVSNFPGTTVDISTGKYKDYLVADTPGVYGVSSFNDEERVARDVIIYGDIILNVVDALHLERDLFLTQQIIDMGKKVVIAFNMMDDVKSNKINIDLKKISDLLGVPVVGTTAVKREGFEELENRINDATFGNRTPIVEELIKELDLDILDSEKLMLLEEDEALIERYPEATVSKKREEIYRARRKRVDQIIEESVTREIEEDSFRIKLGRMMLRPTTGLPILFVALFIIYKIIGDYVAQGVVGYTEGVLMGEYYNNFILGLLGHTFSQGSFWQKFFIGEFGILTMAPIYLLGLLMPLVVAFYFFLSILEDSGYLPRIAALVDRSMTYLGLNGRAIIPMILGFGCVTMGTITTRLLGSKRERFIATLLLGLAIPCSAQLGVIAGIISKLSAKYVVIYALTIVIVFGVIGALLNKIMPGKSTDLLIDLPPLRIPQLKNVLKKTWLKSIFFLEEAAPLFALGAGIITFMEHFGFLNAVISFFAPFTQGMLKLHPKVAQTFIMGIIRRDFGAAGLNSMAQEGLLNAPQLVVSLVVITLFVPCIAATMVIFKERSIKESIIIWFGSFIIAFVVGGILAQIII